MSSFRIDRISEEVRHAIDAIIRDMNDPRISGTYAVTRADVTRDLRWAKVYVSVLEDDKADEMIKALKKAAGYIRHELGLRVDLRYTPELLFERDRNIAYGAHIAQVLKDVIPQEDNSHGEESRDTEGNKD
ncbi:MAG: 30S ribosome-binding factor RbfA [Clostridia bacterium]|nr:30S ribosome-binding factor RbfA [Clostridia bacterium]